MDYLIAIQTTTVHFLNGIYSSLGVLGLAVPWFVIISGVGVGIYKCYRRCSKGSNTVKVSSDSENNILTAESHRETVSISSSYVTVLSSTNLTSSSDSDESHVTQPDNKESLTAITNPDTLLDIKSATASVTDLATDPKPLSFGEKSKLVTSKELMEVSKRIKSGIKSGRSKNNGDGEDVEPSKEPFDHHSIVNTDFQTYGAGARSRNSQSFKCKLCKSSHLELAGTCNGPAVDFVESAGNRRSQYQVDFVAIQIEERDSALYRPQVNKPVANRQTPFNQQGREDFVAIPITDEPLEANVELPVQPHFGPTRNNFPLTSCSNEGRKWIEMPSQMSNQFSPMTVNERSVDTIPVRDTTNPQHVVPIAYPANAQWNSERVAQSDSSRNIKRNDNLLSTVHENLDADSLLRFIKQYHPNAITSAEEENVWISVINKILCDNKETNNRIRGKELKGNEERLDNKKQISPKVENPTDTKKDNTETISIIPHSESEDPTDFVQKEKSDTVKVSELELNMLFQKIKKKMEDLDRLENLKRADSKCNASDSNLQAPVTTSDNQLKHNDSLMTLPKESVPKVSKPKENAISKEKCVNNSDDPNILSELLSNQLRDRDILLAFAKNREIEDRISSTPLESRSNVSSENPKQLKTLPKEIIDALIRNQKADVYNTQRLKTNASHKHSRTSKHRVKNNCKVSFKSCKDNTSPANVIGSNSASHVMEHLLNEGYDLTPFLNHHSACGDSEMARDTEDSLSESTVNSLHRYSHNVSKQQNAPAHLSDSFIARSCTHCMKKAPSNTIASMPPARDSSKKCCEAHIANNNSSTICQVHKIPTRSARVRSNREFPPVRHSGLSTSSSCDDLDCNSKDSADCHRYIRNVRQRRRSESSIRCENKFVKKECDECRIPSPRYPFTCNSASADKYVEEVHDGTQYMAREMRVKSIPQCSEQINKRMVCEMSKKTVSEPTPLLSKHSRHHQPCAFSPINEQVEHQDSHHNRCVQEHASSSIQRVQPKADATCSRRSKMSFTTDCPQTSCGKVHDENSRFHHRGLTDSCRERIRDGVAKIYTHMNYNENLVEEDRHSRLRQGIRSSPVRNHGRANNRSRQLTSRHCRNYADATIEEVAMCADDDCGCHHLQRNKQASYSSGVTNLGRNAHAHVADAHHELKAKESTPGKCKDCRTVEVEPSNVTSTSVQKHRRDAQKTSDFSDHGDPSMNHLPPPSVPATKVKSKPPVVSQRSSEMDMPMDNELVLPHADGQAYPTQLDSSGDEARRMEHLPKVLGMVKTRYPDIEDPVYIKNMDVVNQLKNEMKRKGRWNRQ